MTRHPPRAIPRAAAPLDAAGGRRASPHALTRAQAAPFVRSQLARRLAFETLEPRILFSADVAPVLLSDVVVAAPAARGAEFRTLADAAASPVVIGAPPAAAPRARELAIVDATVPDHDRLVELLRDNAAARGRELDAVLVARGRDGIEAVSAALVGRTALEALHIVSHGDTGGVWLGATRLDLASLAAHADTVRGWGAALAPEGDLLLYGCDAAASFEGRALVDALARLTGADVAASDDATGSPERGGDWQLEVTHGAVDTPAGPGDATAWDGLLAATYWLGGDTTEPFSELETAPPTDTTWDAATNNYDPGEDTVAGRVIKKDSASYTQGDASKHHTWTVAAPTGGLVINDERVLLSLWMAMKDFATDKNGAATAYLLDLASATATDGTLIAQANVAQPSWSGSYTEKTFDFGFVTRTIAAGRYLGVKVVVGSGSGDDVWFAYDATMYPSRLQIGVPNGPLTGTPAIAGLAQENETLTADVSGLADPEGIAAIAYVWQRSADGGTTWSDVPGATSATYLLGDADVGARMRVSLWVMDGAGMATTVASPASPVVANVNDAPVAANELYVLGEDTALGVAGAGVLANDTDADGPVLAAMLVTGPSRGTLTLASNGAFSYVPDPDFFGLDTFTYVASDGMAVSNVATVTLSVANVADSTLTVTTTADSVDGDVSSIDALLASRGADGAVSLREAILAANASPNGVGSDRIHFGIAGAGPHVIDVLSALPAIVDALVIDGATQAGYGGAPLVQLDGGGGAGDGLVLSADASTVRGLAITGFAQSGVVLSGSGGHRLQANYIGLDADGLSSHGNGAYGVRLDSGGNLVGGTTAADRNVISGNAIDGINVAGGDANIVQGNFIGTNAAGTAALGNGEDGVWVSGGSGAWIGGTAPGAANLIAGNAWGGVAVTGATGTRILGNSISDNGRLGIDRGGDGVTTAGVPVLDWASAAGAIAGALLDAPSTTYRVEFFASPAADPSGYGEGRRFLGALDVTTDASGLAQFTASVATFAVGEMITATATHLASGDTSEFGMAVAATPANGAPLGADATVTANEDMPYVFAVTDFPLADPDAGDVLGGIVVETLPGAGTLTVGGVAVVAGRFVSAAEIAGGLLTYAAPAGASGMGYAAFDFTVRDSGVPPSSAPTPSALTVDVLAVNDPPVIGSLGGDTQTYAEGGPLTLADTAAAATVSDADSLDFATGALTVSIVAGGDAAEDVLAIRHQGTGSGQIGVSGADVRYGGALIGTFSGGAGGADLVVTLNANASPAAVQALVRNVGYRNTDTDHPTPGARTIRFVVTDGDGGTSASVQTTVTVTQVNDPPVATIVPGTYSVTENVPFTLSGTGISVADVDAVNGIVRVTVSVTSGSLSVAAGATGVTIGGGGTSVRLDGTLAQVNELLAGVNGGLLQYVMPSDSPPATDSLVVSINDNGHGGTGGPLAGADSALIRITAVNDGPINVLPGTAITTEDTSIVFAAGQIAVSDVDAGASGVQVTLGVTNGRLTLSGTTGLSFATGDGTADASMIFTGTVAAVNAALSGLVFTPTADSTATAVITLSTSDLGNTGTGGALADVNDTTTIVVQPANDPPTAAGGTVTTPPGVAYVFSVADFGFADPDTGDALSAVRIDQVPTRGELRVAGVSVIIGDVITAAQLAAGELTFTLSGAALPDPTFEYGVRDAAGAFSGSATMTVRIANTPPSGMDGTVLTFEGTALVLDASAFGFTDADAGDALTAVRIDTLPAVGTVMLNGAPVSAGDIITRADLDAGLLAYAPPAAGTGAPLATFSFSVRDAYGPDFAVDANVLSVHVAAALGPPSIVAPATVNATEDAPRSIAGISVSDANGDLASVGLAAGSGTLTVSLAGGATIVAGTNGAGALTLTGTQPQINAALATLVYRGIANFTGSDTIVVSASDTLGASSSAAIAVTVGAVNDAPSAVIAPTGYAVDEGVVLQVGGTGLSVGDIDSTTVTVTLSVLSGSLTVGGWPGVSVVGSGSPVVVLSGAVADINALLADPASVTYLMSSDAPPAIDTLRLAVNDGAGGSAFDLAQIAVAPVNDAPVNTLPGTATTLEDTPIVFGAGQIAIADPDVGTAEVRVGINATRGVLDLASVGGLTFLSGDGTADAAMSFRGTLAAVNAALAGLRYTPDLHHNGLAYIDIASDDLGGFGSGGALADSDRMTIDIAPVNDAPVGTDAIRTATEDTPYVLSAADFGYTDVDTGDWLSGVRIDTLPLPVGATLQLAGVAVTVGQVIDYTDLAAGRLTFQGAPDANGAAHASFAFSVRDAGGLAFDATPRTLVFDVAAVNDAPVNTLPTTTIAVTAEDMPLVLGGAAGLRVSDVDVGTGLMEVTLSTSHGVLDLATGAGLAFQWGDGVGDASMRFRGTLSDVHAALDGLVFTPVPDYNGTATLTLVTSDLGASGAGTSLSDSDTLAIAVTPVNDAPAGTDATAVALEDTAYVLSAASFGFTDIDAGDALSAVRIDTLALPTGATLTLSGTAVVVGQVIAATDIAAGRLVFNAAPDAHGAGYATLVFSVRDTGGLAFDPSPNTLLFDVAPVNDAPVITSNGGGAAAALTFAENATGTVTTVAASDIDSPGSARTYAIAGGADAARFAIDATTGELRFVAPPDFEAPADVNADNVYDVVVSVADGSGGGDLQALAITVTGTDEAPLPADDTYTVIEDASLTVDASAGVLANDLDPENGALTATLVTAPTSGTVTLGTDGRFLYTPDANFTGTDSFRYRVSDSAGGSGIATVIIDVAPENRAPTSADGAVSTDAGVAYVFTLADFAFDDQDGDALAAITVTSLPAAGALELDGAPVVVGQIIDAADISAGLLRYLPPATGGVTLASFGYLVSDGVASAAAPSTITIGIAPPPLAQTSNDGAPGGGSGASATPTPESAPSPTARGATPGGAPADAPPSGGGRSGGGGSGSDGGDSAQPATAADGTPKQTTAALGVAPPTAATATGLSSSGPAGEFLAAMREATLGGVQVHDGSAHEADSLSAKAVKAIEALAAPTFREELDRLREEQAGEATMVTRVAGSVMVVSSGLSVGYVLWLLRGGVLLASLLTSLPAWRIVDPIAVFGRVGDEDEDDDSLQDMVNRDKTPDANAKDTEVDR